MTICRTRRNSFTATKDADSSGHRLYCSVSSFLTPYRPPTALDPCLRADWPSLRLGLESLTLCSGVSLLTDQRHSSFPSSLAGSRERIQNLVDMMNLTKTKIHQLRNISIPSWWKRPVKYHKRFREDACLSCRRGYIPAIKYRWSKKNNNRKNNNKKR